MFQRFLFQLSRFRCFSQNCLGGIKTGKKLQPLTTTTSQQPQDVSSHHCHFKHDVFLCLCDCIYLSLSLFVCLTLDESCLGWPHVCFSSLSLSVSPAFSLTGAQRRRDYGYNRTRAAHCWGLIVSERATIVNWTNTHSPHCYAIHTHTQNRQTVIEITF